MPPGSSRITKSRSKKKQSNSEAESPRPTKKSCQPEPAIIPVATQLKDAHGFTISGNPNFTNISGANNVANVINYGSSQGLEIVKPFVSFAARFNSAEQDPTRQCHPGTRKAILAQIQNWIDNPSPQERIFWLHGPAGAGKSAIAQTIARSNSQEKVAATFFFYRSDPTRNNGNSLFTTLAWQLAFSIPAVKPFIVDALEKQPDLPTTDVETQFDQLIVRPFQQLGNHIPHSPPHPLPVIIIDGVDECADEKLQQRVLKAIGDTVGNDRVPLRFFICSRPEADINMSIKRFQTPPLIVDLAELDDANHDIEKYLRDEFSRIALEQDLDSSVWPGEQTIRLLVFKASGNFIFAATVIRYVGDSDYIAQDQLAIILGLATTKSTSPFAQLDELYMVILRRQVDQDFLKIFLALLVGRSSVQVSPLIFVGNYINLAEDDALLMAATTTELHIKLRRMRSLLKFEPHIAVHHRSFIDFLMDSSRSDHYHVSKEGGIMRYLELIANWIVQYAEIVTKYPDFHVKYHFRPRFVDLLANLYPSDIPLLVEEWEKALDSLLCLRDKFLRIPNFNSTWDILPCNECFAFYTMRCLLSRLAILQGCSLATKFSTHIKQSFNDESAVRCGTNIPLNPIFIEANVSDMDLNTVLPLLLSWLQKSRPIESLSNIQTISLLRSLLRFDYADVAGKIPSVADAQDLVDIIDDVINNQYLFGQLRPDEISWAIHLALRLCVKALVLPRSFFLELNCNGHLVSICNNVEAFVHISLMGRILDRNFIGPTYNICAKHQIFLPCRPYGESITKWRRREKPSSVTKIKVMLTLARAFQYVHSFGIVLSSCVDDILLNSKLRAQIVSGDLIILSPMMGLLYPNLIRTWTFEGNVFSFGCFFYETYFDIEIGLKDTRECNGNAIKRPHSLEIREDVWHLIQRCCMVDPKSRPTMNGVVKEMESWELD